MIFARIKNYNTKHLVLRDTQVQGTGLLTLVFNFNPNNDRAV